MINAGCPISAKQLSELLLGGDVQLIDVRGYEEFGGARLACSICIPLNELRERIGEVGIGSPVVLVCETGRRSTQAAAILEAAGIAAGQLEGGLASWRQHGLPLRIRPVWSLERQVRLGAGALLLCGLAGAHLWTPLRLLSWLVGCGLVLAAISGTCLMGALLMRLPWNRRQACEPADLRSPAIDPEKRHSPSR